MQKSPSFSIDDLFAKVQSNLEKHGSFQVGKCHGKPTMASSSAGNGGFSSREFKKRALDSNVEETLFPTQLRRPLIPLPDVAVSKRRSHSRSPSPPSFTTDGCNELKTAATSPKRRYSRLQSPIVEPDSEPPPYIPLCMRNKTESNPLETACVPSLDPPKPSFQPFSWAAPAFDVGMNLSSFASASSESKKRTREELADEEYAKTATAKIAAAAARESSDSFFFLGGPRFTQEEADGLVDLADRWFPSNAKKAKR